MALATKDSGQRSICTHSPKATWLRFWRQLASKFYQRESSAIRKRCLWRSLVTRWHIAIGESWVANLNGASRLKFAVESLSIPANPSRSQLEWLREICCGCQPSFLFAVVDAVMENARSLQRQGSVQDRRKLNEYLHSVRSIEKRNRFAEQRTSACQLGSSAG